MSHNLKMALKKVVPSLALILVAMYMVGGLSIPIILILGFLAGFDCDDNSLSMWVLKNFVFMGIILVAYASLATQWNSLIPPVTKWLAGGDDPIRMLMIMTFEFAFYFWIAAALGRKVGGRALEAVRESNE